MKKVPYTSFFRIKERLTALECLPKPAVALQSASVTVRAEHAKDVPAIATQKATPITDARSKPSSVPSTPVRKATPKASIYESMWAVREGEEQPVEG